MASPLDHIDRGDLEVPEGVSFEFSGSYENQVRSEKRLMVLVPVALAFVFILLYLQFSRVSTSAIIFSGRDLFQVGTINLSVAVWIGFIALIGIATDDGVVLCTYLKQRFAQSPPQTIQEVRARTLEAGTRRIRPCLMTTATTILALLPVISSQGRE